MHQDHMFTQDELKKNGMSYAKTNSIGNLRYTTANENMTRGATPYAKWVKTLNIQQREKELLPNGDFDISTYSSFLSERVKLIESRLKDELSL